MGIRQRLLDLRENKAKLVVMFTMFVGVSIMAYGAFIVTTDPDNMTSDTFASILIVGLVVAAGPYAYVQYAEFSRIRQMEEHLPNFLRSIAEARRAGMTLPQAIANASKTDYGPLSPEIKVMAAQLSWGIPFPMVVELFNQRNNQSPFMQQSMGIIIEAYRSGGDVADTMDAVATDSRLVKDLEAEQKAKMSAQVMVMYVIHIIFLVIIYALNAILKPLLVMQKGEGMATMFGSSGGKALTPGGYRSLFMNMCYIEGIYNGLIAGEVGDGSVVAGFKHSLIMLSMAVLMFALVIKTELIGMQPLTISSYLYPDEQIPLDILVSRDDGTPVKRASVGAVITCSAGASCQEGQIVCKVDPACNMCTCARTDDWGRTKLSIKAPIEAGDYELKVVVVDDQVSKARISETAYFTVG